VIDREIVDLEETAKVLKQVNITEITA